MLPIGRVPVPGLRRSGQPAGQTWAERHAGLTLAERPRLRRPATRRHQPTCGQVCEREGELLLLQKGRKALLLPRVLRVTPYEGGLLRLLASP